MFRQKWCACFLLAILFHKCICTPNNKHEHGNDASTSSASRDAWDCPMRQLLLEYAVEIQPNITSDRLQEIADALNGTPEKAPNCTVEPTNAMKQRPNRHAPSWNDLRIFEHSDTLDNSFNSFIIDPSIPQLNQITLFVSITDGNDNNIGTIVSPLRTLKAAIEKCKKYNSNVFKRIVLRQGTYYLSNTIRFGWKDSNYLISNFNHEYVKISGAVPIDCNWKFYQNGISFFQLCYFRILLGFFVCKIYFRIFLFMYRFCCFCCFIFCL